jgi:hypothetical protein
METLTLLGIVEGGELPVLRIAFTLATLGLATAGLFIYHNRHKLFDRDPDVENDVPAVRHNRFEEVIFVWTGLMLVTLAVLYQLWLA